MAATVKLRFSNY